MRLNVTKTKNSSSFYIIKSFRDNNGKATSKIIEKLGTLEEVTIKANGEDPYVWAKKRAAFLTQQEKEQNLSIDVSYSPAKPLEINKINSFNIGYLFTQKIYHSLQLDKLIKSIADASKITFDLNDIILTLINTRILYPSSKKSSFHYSEKFLDKPNFDLHHIYRGLDVLEENSALIQETLYKNSLSIVDRESSILYYDCTNYFFEIEEASGLKQYGKSKENRPNPIVQMGLFMDGSGIPLAFDLTSGNTNEQTTLKPLEKQIIKDFNMSKLIVVTDAGLSSNANKKFNDIANRGYITVQSLKKLKKHLKEWALDPKGWRLRNSDSEIDISDIPLEGNHHVYYKERWIHENGIEERLIVTWSPKHALYQRSIRNNQVERCQTKIKNGSLKRRSMNPNDSSRFAKTMHTTKQGEVAEETEYHLDYERIVQEEKYDGFYGIVTNVESSIEDIVEINQRRWEIEETFRIMKSEFKSRPVYVQKDNRIKAHFLTCFMAMTIFRILEKILDRKYSAESIIKTLRELNVGSIRGEGYIPHFTRTDITDSLQKEFGYEINTEIIPMDRMKKIKRNSKTRKLTTKRT